MAPHIKLGRLGRISRTLRDFAAARAWYGRKPHVRGRLPGRVRAAVAAALALSTPLVARAERCRLEVVPMPVHMVHMRPIVTLGINGTQVPLLLDTGAFFSVLTEAAAKQLQLKTRRMPHGMVVSGYTGDLEARLGTADKVEVLGVDVPNVEFIVGLNEPGDGVMGVLGRNFLRIADNEFDLAHGVVRLAFPKGDCSDADFPYWAGRTPVNVIPLLRQSSSNDTSLRVDVGIDGREVRAELDTGAITSLSLNAAHRAGIADAAMKPASRIGGGGAGHAASWTTGIATVSIGGETVRNNVMQVNDADVGDFDMLLGVDYFLSHRMYVSRAERKIYATWNGGVVFARNGIQADDSSDEARYGAAPAAPSADDVDALVRTGEAELARGQADKAMVDLDRAVTLAPDNPAIHLARARLRVSRRDFAGALADVEESLRSDPANALALLLRAQLRANGSVDRPGALDDLRTLDATLSPDSNLRAPMGGLQDSLDEPDAALRQWRLWLSTHPHDAGRGAVLNSECWLRVRRRLDLDRALEACKAAVDEDGDNVNYRDSLGWTYLRLGKPRQAVDSFDRAIALRSRSPWSLFGRAQAKALSGDAAGARADLAAARDMDAHIDAEAAKAGFDPAPDVVPAALAASAAR